MKALLLGAWGGYSNAPHEKGIPEAFKELGWDYLVIDIQGKSYDDRETRLDLFSKTEQYKPDLIFHELTDTVYNEFFNPLKECAPKAKQVFWMCDLTFEAPKINGQNLDTVFISNKDQIPHYKYLWNVANVQYLPQAHCRIDKIQNDKSYKDKIVFIGTTGKGGFFLDDRTEIVDKLIKAFPNSFRLIHSPNIAGQNEIYKQMPMIYGSADVSLSYSRFHDIRGYTSNRFFTILGNGGLCLSKRFPDCEELFEDKKHCVYFDTTAEAIDLIKYYQKHEAEREKIRRAGFAHAQKEHIYAKRIAKMLDCLALPYN